MLVGRDEVEPPATPVSVFHGYADGLYQRLHLPDQVEPACEVLPAPGRRLPNAEPWAVDGQSSRFELRQTADQRVRAESAASNRRVHRAGVVVETLAAVFQEHPVLRRLTGLGTSQRERTLEFVQHHPLVGLVAVQLETGVAKVDGVEAPLYDFERGHLLRDEEDLLVARERLGQQVGDRLRLPGSGRSLDDQVAAVHGVDHGEGLGAVRVDYLVEALLAEPVVDMLFGADDGRIRGEAIAPVELSDQRMISRLVLFRPVLRVEILVYQQLAEREEVQVDFVVVDRPPLLTGHRLPHPVHVFVDVQILFTRHLRKADAEVLLQLGFQREVGFDLVPVPRQLEVLADTGPVEPDGDQDQRRAPLRGAVLGFVPAQHPQSQVEDVDALFLDGQTGLPEGLAQAEVQAGKGHGRLQLVVRVPCGDLVGVIRGHSEHVDEFRGNVGEVLVGGSLAKRFRSVLSCREEIHDTPAAHEDPEQFAGQFVHDLDAPPP